MSVNSFDELVLALRENSIKFRTYISLEEKITITLRFLATGKDFKTLAEDFGIGHTTVRAIIIEICKKIWLKLSSQEMPVPTTQTWLQKAEEFYENSQFPLCIGAVDAVCDANYLFTSIDVGAYGREGDSQILWRSNIGKKLKNNSLNIPMDSTLPNDNSKCQLPYIIVGDEAFGLHRNIMRPYPGKKLSYAQRVFNYRLCRARRYIECSFGILANKWRIFHTPMMVEPKFATLITKTACVLHNYVRRRDGYRFSDTLTNVISSADRVSSGTTQVAREAREARDKFANYFLTSEGRLPWQDKYI
ncbi:hypothetical protein evm_011371 [Chilo suppressalis]|nr:hypothetical protein evm_011371 [Chilo suppressalis]